jgi:DNA-binding NtrC family response regulator
LRERLADLRLLVDSLLAHLGVDDVESTKFVRSEEFLEDLTRHSWPGNVRELRNYVERCLALNEQAPLWRADQTVDDEARIDASQPLRQAREKWLRSFERRYLEEVLRLNRDNVTAAARAAGVDRIYFYRLLWRHGLR